jgi:hypothetical protein
MKAVFVTKRQVVEQVFDDENVLFAKRFGDGWADSFDELDGSVERQHRRDASRKRYGNYGWPFGRSGSFGKISSSFIAGRIVFLLLIHACLVGVPIRDCAKAGIVFGASSLQTHQATGDLLGKGMMATAMEFGLGHFSSVLRVSGRPRPWSRSDA